MGSPISSGNCESCHSTYSSTFFRSFRTSNNGNIKYLLP
ncbi:hypothetical protein Q9F26_004443 [Vibrio parahaemolyticus]|nr:hypothetical protein [Vibrio parahaemolyticus]ELA7420769.1 hypothetical protein [Vibrio parahaemolyticus]RZP85414.1 hypothetical protein D8T56_22105 [Vibrio vulnificus]